VICESATKAKLPAAVVPNLTAVTPVSPQPLIVTVWPPPTGPELGLTDVMLGVVQMAATGRVRGVRVDVNPDRTSARPTATAGRRRMATDLLSTAG
jgi:hypothetical protein